MFSILTGRALRPNVFRNLNRAPRAFQSTASGSSPAKKATGLKGLMQEYGYSALGVYLAIGAVDLPLCYALVQFAGEEKIGEYEDKVKQFFGFGKKTSDQVEGDSNAQSAPHHSSFWTKFAIAYGIHKSLIFIRLPIAAAITPAVVSKLRSMGFNIGNKQFRTIATSAKESYKEHGLRKSVSSRGVKKIMDNSKLPSNKPLLPPSQAPSSASLREPATKPNFGTPASKKQRWWSWFF